MVLKLFKIPDGSIRIILQGLQRIRLDTILQNDPYLRARIHTVNDIFRPSIKTDALQRTVLDGFRTIVNMSKNIPDEILTAALNINEPSVLADFITSNMDMKLEDRQNILQEANVETRLKNLSSIIGNEIKMLEIGSKIQSQISSEFDKSQRNYFLKEQLKAIKRELGEVEDHYGLDDIKERILEFLAVRKLNSKKKSPILCFVGPPGVEKTSLGQSIARALGRKFIRISLGGIRDEAEIRGHRRTYVGALPGRIMHGIKKAGTNNPVFMLDEVDKLGNDFRGDPSSALLEVLDPQQNDNFSDHYIEVQFDLSNVMFITTANELYPIPLPLRDRMEIIQLPGYINEDKLMIALRYLIPRQIDENALTGSSVSFTRPALQRIISEYTREAGVRNLEREIGRICRKIARQYASGNKKKVKVDKERVAKYLGSAKYISDMAKRENEIGIATGLVWTPFGGEVLYIESVLMKGNKGFILTGQLGDVMKESARAALSSIRSKSDELNIDTKIIDKNDIHIHIPAGATPKARPFSRDHHCNHTGFPVDKTADTERYSDDRGNNAQR